MSLSGAREGAKLYARTLQAQVMDDLCSQAFCLGYDGTPLRGGIGVENSGSCCEKFYKGGSLTVRVAAIINRKGRQMKKMTWKRKV